MKSGDEMKIHVLASGSKGNMTLLKGNEGWLAVDCGISKKKILEKLEELNVKIDEISTLIITHEHSDHVAGLKALVKMGHLTKIYMTQGTFESLKSDDQQSVEAMTAIIPSEGEFFVDVFQAQTFIASHDASEPIGLVLKDTSFKVVVGTDTGYIDQKYESLLKDADVYLIEANHHPKSLLASPRPMHLKRRILGEKGHLNNEDAASLIGRVMGHKKTHWIVMHISEDCNTQLDIEKAIVTHVKDPRLLEVYYASQHQVVSVEL